MFDLSQPAISRHLRVLREADLVNVRVDAQRRVYSLNARPLQDLDRWLEPYRAFWTTKLDAFERHLDTKPKKGTRQ